MFMSFYNDQTATSNIHVPASAPYILTCWWVQGVAAKTQSRFQESWRVSCQVQSNAKSSMRAELGQKKNGKEKWRSVLSTILSTYRDIMMEKWKVWHRASTMFEVIWHKNIQFPPPFLGDHFYLLSFFCLHISNYFHFSSSCYILLPSFSL